MTDKQINDAAELAVRRYFDHFLTEIHPKLMAEHLNACPCGKQISKIKYGMVGFGIALVVLYPTVGNVLFELVGKMKGV